VAHHRRRSRRRAPLPGRLPVRPVRHVRDDDVVRPRKRFIPDGVELLYGEIERLDPAADVARLADGRELPYDLLIIATGTSPRPDQTPGMLGAEWRRSVHEFYTLEGAAR
jgi:sulfide:quinone oxidoreductase